MSSNLPTLGILGSGQLAAMLTDAANRLGIDVHVYRPTESSDRWTANHITTSPFDDVNALRQFAAGVDAVTVETENIPVVTLQVLEDLVPVHPSSRVVAICQDRLIEKQFLTNNGVPTARYVPVESASGLADAVDHLGGPGILKTSRFGYDGKGQTRVQVDDDAGERWQHHGDEASVLEELIGFDCEISVVAARTQSGQIAIFDPGKNEHRDGILHQTEVPTQLASSIEQQACAITRNIVIALDYVGVIGVEFFVVGSELLVNEIAPRVHNSGHWTQEGCAVDQFEQHVRAVMGLPLGSPERHCDVVMTNIMGSDANDVSSLLQTKGTRIHLYGKREARPGRKMGHSNAIRPRNEAL